MTWEICTIEVRITWCIVSVGALYFSGIFQDVFPRIHNYTCWHKSCRRELYTKYVIPQVFRSGSMFETSWKYSGKLCDIRMFDIFCKWFANQVQTHCNIHNISPNKEIYNNTIDTKFFFFVTGKIAMRVILYLRICLSPQSIVPNLLRALADTPTAHLFRPSAKTKRSRRYHMYMYVHIFLYTSIGRVISKCKHDEIHLETNVNAI